MTTPTPAPTPDPNDTSAASGNVENPAEAPAEEFSDQQPDQADVGVTQQPPENAAQDVLHDTDTDGPPPQ